MTTTTTTASNRTTAIACVLSVVLGTSIALSAADERSAPPEVGERYQSSITTAWDEAGQGQDPSMTCARVKGRVAGTKDSQAFRALFACNVDIPVRYFNAYLDDVAAGERSCQDLMREVMTKLPAMTMSADMVIEMANDVEQGDDPEAAIVDALGDSATGATEDGELKHPKRLVKDRIAERTTELCPDFASVIVG